MYCNFVKREKINIGNGTSIRESDTVKQHTFHIPPDDWHSSGPRVQEFKGGVTLTKRYL